jgi:hypothetical protein
VLNEANKQNLNHLVSITKVLVNRTINVSGEMTAEALPPAALPVWVSSFYDLILALIINFCHYSSMRSRDRTR